MSYMQKGPNDKKSNADSRGSDGEGLGLDAASKANGIEFVESKNDGGEQGASGKNHWDGTGAKPGAENASKGERAPKDGRPERESGYGM